MAQLGYTRKRGKKKLAIKLPKKEINKDDKLSKKTIDVPLKFKSRGRESPVKITNTSSLDIYFLDVGQGDGTFIIFPDGTTMLVDLGSKKNAAIAGSDAVTTICNLLNNGNTGDNTSEENLFIDHLIITHGDADHYNLIKNLMDKNVRFENITYGGLWNEYGRKSDNNILNYIEIKGSVRPVNINGGSPVTADSKVDLLDLHESGMKMEIEDTKKTQDTKKSKRNYSVDIISANRGGTKNQQSIVLQILCGNNRVILTGDADSFVEREILKSLNSESGTLKSNILKLGHHGSASSNSATWLNAVQPIFAFVSCDNQNGFNHPDIRAINRVLKSTNVKNKNTAEKHGWIIGNVNSKKTKTASKTKKQNYQNFKESNPQIEIDYKNSGTKYIGVTSTDAIFSNLYKLEKNKSGYTAMGTTYLCELGIDGQVAISYLDSFDKKGINTVCVYNGYP